MLDIWPDFKTHESVVGYDPAVIYNSNHVEDPRNWSLCSSWQFSFWWLWCFWLHFENTLHPERIRYYRIVACGGDELSATPISASLYQRKQFCHPLGFISLKVSQRTCCRSHSGRIRSTIIYLAVQSSYHNFSLTTVVFPSNFLWR